MLKIGIIGNKELLSEFGTEKNKEDYIKNNKLQTNTKKSLFKKAYSKYDIEDISNGFYKIHNIRDIELPKEFINLNRDIYKFLSPLIIKIIINNYYNESNPFNITIFKYAYDLGAISKNYTLIKKYKTSAKNLLDLEMNNIINFYSNIDRCIKYYIKNCLELLKKADILDYKEPDMLAYRYSDHYHGINSYYSTGSDYYKFATIEEIRLYIDIEEKVMKSMGIENRQQAYYGKLKNKYKEELKKELSKNTIKDSDGNEIIMLLKFTGYTIFYTSIDKCKNMLDNYENIEDTYLKDNLNIFFINFITEYSKNNKAIFKDVLEQSKYIGDFNILSNLTLRHDAEEISLNKDMILKKHKNKDLNSFQYEVLFNEY